MIDHLRFPFAALAEAMGMSEHRAAVQLRLSGSTEQDYRRRGVTERVADRLAVAAGLHPLEVWPDLHDTVTRECASSDCATRFVPEDRGRPHLYCSRRCRLREKQRRRRQGRPDVREREAERQRAYYASLSPAADAARLAKRRAHYYATRGAS